MHAASVTQANSVLSSGSTIRLVKEFPDAFKLLGTPGSLTRVAKDVLDLKGPELGYIAAIPEALQEAIRSAIFAAASQDKPVQISYAPAYDFEVQLWDYGEAVTIQVRGPYQNRSPAGKKGTRKSKGKGKSAAARTRKKKAARRQPAR